MIFCCFLLVLVVNLLFSSLSFLHHPIPPPQAQREAKRAAGSDQTSTGLSPAAVHELVLLQHVYYCSTSASGIGSGGSSGSGSCSEGYNGNFDDSSSGSGSGGGSGGDSFCEAVGVAAPLGVATLPLTADTPSAERRLCALPTDPAPAPLTGHFGLATPLLAPAPPRLRTQGDPALVAALTTAGSLGTGDRVQRYLVLPAVHVALPAVLPLVLGALGPYCRPALSAWLAREWCRDVLRAVGHCVRAGVYFRWISIDQVKCSGRHSDRSRSLHKKK